MAARERARLHLAALLAFGMLALRAWLEWVGALPGDRATGEWFDDRGLSPRADEWLEVVTAFGRPDVALLTAVALAALLAATDGTRAAVAVLVAALVVPITALLKLLLGPTPIFVELVDDMRNYPSGHTAFVTATFATAAAILAAGGRTRIALPLLVPIATIGPAMVLRGAHLPSDVVGGYLLGAAWALVALTIARPRSA